jgi:hypothetical protein
MNVYPGGVYLVSYAGQPTYVDANGKPIKLTKQFLADFKRVMGYALTPLSAVEEEVEPESVVAEPEAKPEE